MDDGRWPRWCHSCDKERSQPGTGGVTPTASARNRPAKKGGFPPPTVHPQSAGGSGFSAHAATSPTAIDISGARSTARCQNAGRRRGARFSVSEIGVLPSAAEATAKGQSAPPITKPPAIPVGTHGLGAGPAQPLGLDRTLGPGKIAFRRSASRLAGSTPGPSSSTVIFGRRPCRRARAHADRCRPAGRDRMALSNSGSPAPFPADSLAMP